jgi:hypothetical protein
MVRPLTCCFFAFPLQRQAILNRYARPDVGDDWFQPHQVPPVDLQLFPSTRPVTHNPHATVIPGTSSAPTAEASLRQWLHRWGVNAKYPSDPDLSQMSLPLLAFYYRWHEYLYGCYRNRRHLPLSPWCNRDRDEYLRLHPSCAMGRKDSSDPVPLFDQRLPSTPPPASVGKQFRPSDKTSDEEESEDDDNIDDSDDDDDVSVGYPDAFLDDNDPVNSNESRPSSTTSVLQGLGKGLARHAADHVAHPVPPLVDPVVHNEHVTDDAATVAGAATVAASATAATTTTVVFPLESTEIDEYRRAEHPEFHKECAKWFRRIIQGKHAPMAFPSNSKPKSIKHLAAYLYLRHLSEQAEYYVVPGPVTGPGDWYQSLTEEEQQKFLPFLQDVLELNRPGDEVYVTKVATQGNPGSWWKNKSRNRNDEVYNFANQVCNLRIVRSKAASAPCNGYRCKRVREDNG